MADGVGPFPPVNSIGIGDKDDIGVKSLLFTFVQVYRGQVFTLYFRLIILYQRVIWLVRYAYNMKVLFTML